MAASAGVDVKGIELCFDNRGDAKGICSKSARCLIKAYGVLWAALAVLSVNGIVHAAALSGDGPATGHAPLAANQRKELLAQRRQFEREWRVRYAFTQYAEAGAAAEKMLAIDRRVYGDSSEEVADSLDRLGESRVASEQFAAARTAFEEALSIRSKRHGERDWRTVDTRLALENGEIHSRLSAQDRRELARAIALQNAVARQHKLGNYRMALQLAEQAVEIQRRLLGELHRDTAMSLNNLAYLYQLTGQYKKSELLSNHLVEVREKIQGELHPATATSLNNLALLYQSMGKYADAAKLLQRSLEIRRKVLGEEHPDVAISFNNLGRANELMGQYAKAEPLYKHGLEIQKNIPRERSADPAIILDNLGGLYLALGQFAKAELLYQRALEIRRKVLGAQHPDTAKGLNNLALVYQASGRSEKAEPLLREALSICQRVLGKQHPDTARSLNNLAMWHRSRDQYAKAESLYEQALAIEKKNVGEDHPDTAETLQNLANLNYLAGRYDKAEPLYQEALAVFKKVLGEQHPETATCLGNLAGLDWSMGQYAKAEPLLRQALASSQRLLVHSFGVLSEREQLAYEANSRFQLDEYLALSGSPEYISAFGPQSVGAAEVYRYVLCGKGIVTAQQAFIHIGLRANKSPKLNRWFQQLQEDSRLLATFRLAPPNQPERLRAWQEEIARLDEERNTVQQKLAAESDEFRRLEESLQADGDQVRKLQHRLSAKTALIDFLEYTHFSPPPDKKGPLRRERRLTAFVVRTGSVQRVDLGPVAPLATAAERWRLAIVKGLGRANDAASGELDGGNLRQAPQQFLREHLIDPLTPHLQGADLALISPDGFVTQVPFAALPGRTKGSYFIEEMSVAVVPVPSDLPVLLSSTVGESAGDPSLLLVGGVDFGGDPGSVLVATNDMTPSQHRSAERGRDRLAFGPLPGTAHEIEEIEKTFHERFADREIEILDKSDATEQRFRLEAPKHRWLHVATHGFFANAGIPSALDRHNEEGRHTEGGGFGFQLQDEGIDPALLSGIVFAGANRDVGSAETSTLDFSKETDDGILTALEISELDLRNVDLAVLSACETGLGRVAGGEGVLGLQRAFQTAGARTCVTSLWKVDDSATELLMKEFYANLWQRKLGKLDSLRQAQLTMLRRYDAAENRLRGLSRVVRLPESAAPSNSSRPAPKYWAPFILSGDWR